MAIGAMSISGCVREAEIYESKRPKNDEMEDVMIIEQKLKQTGEEVTEQPETEDSTKPATDVEVDVTEPLAAKTEPTTEKIGEGEEFPFTVRLTGDLNMRNGPGDDYYLMTTLGYGDAIKVLREESGWYRVDFDGAMGYVSIEVFETVEGARE